jgi:tripartite-type tricarboxylate transporter receptor subunit TctC
MIMYAIDPGESDQGKKGDKEMKKLLILLLVLSVALGSAFATGAQEGSSKGGSSDWVPTKPVTLLTASSAGSGNDTLFRVFAQYLGRYFGGIQINVTNQGGGNGIPAVLTLMGSPADGYTVFGDAALSSSYQLLRDDITYDVMKDRTYIAQIAAQPQVLVTSKQTGWKTLDDVAAGMKKDPTNFIWGAIGGNSAATFAVAALIEAAGVDISQTKKVVQSGGAAILTAIAGNNCVLGSGAAASVSTYVLSDSLVPIAILGKSNLSILPGVKTSFEQGYDIDIGAWIALSAPKGLNPNIVAVYDAAIKSISSDPKFIADLAAIGAAPSYRNTEELKTYIIDEAASASNWAK